MKTEILSLLETKQIWEMSDIQLAQVKMELLRMCRKCNTEQNFRIIAEGQDTPMFDEIYGGWLALLFIIHSILSHHA